MGIISEKTKEKAVREVVKAFKAHFMGDEKADGDLDIQELVNTMVDQMTTELKQAAWNLLGVEMRWAGEASFTRDSPLESTIASAIRDKTLEVASAFIVNYQFNLSTKEAKMLHDEVREKYLRTLVRRATDMAIAEAESASEVRVKAILGELFDGESKQE